MARLIGELGCSVVAVTDVKGGVHRDDGLDVPALWSWAQESGSVVGFSGAEEISTAELLERPDPCFSASDRRAFTDARRGLALHHRPKESERSRR